MGKGKGDCDEETWVAVMTSGIYAIVNKVDGKRYVGSTNNFKRRFGHHVSRLRRLNHYNEYLQKAWAKYGEPSFEFVILEECSVECLLDREQFYLDERSEYNLAKCAEATGRGIKRSPETIERMRRAVLGTKHTDETKKKMSLAGKGRVFSEEHKRRIGDGHRGMVMPEEAKRRLSEIAKGRPSAFKGRKHSEESLQKMSAWQKGKPGRPHTEEELRKMSIAQLGRHHTEETKRKISEKRKGNRNAARLTEDNVREIRRLYKEGNTSFRKLSVMFDVALRNIACIIHRLTWRDIE